MSSFKKLRLDPETPIQGTHRNLLSNQPGASDAGGRGYIDSSSFSSSTSGGSGTYMRSAGPFRTRYSQPLRIPSPNASSFSRFAPYYFGKERRSTLRVPLIRARRDESDSEGYRPSSRASLNSSLGGDSTASVTTSTAQRIIEALHNLSTPVINAGKIRIDQDIKAVQPLPFGSGSPLSRYSPGSPLNRSTGPPKMCSSLLLSNPSTGNQISPVSNLGDQRRLFCIPRMIDAATNTDKDSGTVSASPTLRSGKVDVEYRASSQPAPKQMFGGTATKSVVTTKDDNSNSEEEFHECSSDFAFSPAWAPQVFDRYLSNEKEDKSSEKGSQQPPIINGYKEAVPSTSASMMPVPAKTTSFFTSNPPSVSSPPSKSIATSGSNFTGFGTGTSAAQFSFGASPLKSASSTLGKQGESIPLLNTKQSLNEPQETLLSATKQSTALSSASGTFQFGNQAAGEGATPSKSTFSFGKDSSQVDKPIASSSFDKVDAAKMDNLTSGKLPSSSSSNITTPKTALPPLTVKKAGSKWSCPTCMVDNDLNAPACVCCSEKNPNAPSAGPAPAAKKWRCPTCMVENDPTAPACVCCTEKNPNACASKKDEATSGNGGTSAFKFGISNSQGAPPPPSSTFSFGQGQPQSTEAQNSPMSTFKFGAPTASSASTASTLSSPNVPSSITSPPLSSQPANTNSPFKFSSSTPATTLPSSSALSFGSSPQTTTASSSMFGSNLSASFKFGGIPTTSSDPQKTAPPLGFGASTTASSVSPNVSSVTTSVPSGPLSSQPLNTNSPFKASSSTLPTTLPSSTSPFSFSSPLSTGSQLAATTTAASASTTMFGSSKPTPEVSISSNPPLSTPAFGSSSFQSPAAQSAPSFNFGGAPAGAKPFGSFGSFGSSQPQSQGPSAPLVPATQVSSSASVPGIGAAPGFGFGSNTPSAASPFGQVQSPSSNPTPPPASGGLFQFGAGASTFPTPAPTFSLTPNLNFGSAPSSSSIPFGNPPQSTPNAGSQPPPALFQFAAATPNENPRKFKKAVRRFNK